MGNVFLVKFKIIIGVLKMPPSYKLKVIVLGPSKSGKEYFFNKCDQILDIFSESYYLTIGVSIKTAEYLHENNEILHFSIWDINTSERFHFIYHAFFRGASGCLLFFDVLNFNQSSELVHWIDIIRNHVGFIPLFLVGTTSANLTDDVDCEEINSFVETNHLDGFFLMPSQTNLIFERFARAIYENIILNPKKKEFQNILTSEERKMYEKFLKFFKNCPVCGGKNHRVYLRNLYFNRSPLLKNLKKRLMSLMEESKNFDKIYYNKINIGIPCCSCFSKFFTK